MYKLLKDYLNNEMSIVQRTTDNACIPYDPQNVDFQQFKKDITNGVSLQDATGTAITDITTFLGTLP